MANPVSIGMFAASTVMGAMQTRQQNKALARQAAANNEYALKMTAELKRQQKVADLQAQGEKSDVVKEMNRRIGMMRAISADGGRGDYSSGKMFAAAAAIAALDIGRFERDRREQAAQRSAQQENVIAGVQAEYRQIKARQKSNTLSFIGSTIFSGYSVYKDGGFGKLTDPSAGAALHQTSYRGMGSHPYMGTVSMGSPSLGWGY